MRRTRFLDRSSKPCNAAAVGNLLQTTQSDCPLAGWQCALCEDKEPPLRSVSMVGMLADLPMPGEYIDIRWTARTRNPGTPLPRPVSLAGCDVEARIALRPVRFPVPGLTRRRLLDFKPGPGRKMLAIPRRPIPAVFGRQPPSRPERKRDHAFHIIAALGIVDDGPIIPANEQVRRNRDFDPTRRASAGARCPESSVQWQLDCAG